LYDHCVGSKSDVVVVKGLKQPFHRLALDISRFGGAHGELEPAHNSILQNVGDALHLEGQQELLAKFGVLEHCAAELLGNLSRLFDVHVTGETQVEFDGCPISAEVRDRSELTKRYGVELPVLVAKPY